MISTGERNSVQIMTTIKIAIRRNIEKNVSLLTLNSIPPIQFIQL